MARRAPPGPLEYLRRWPLRLWLAGVGLFLVLVAAGVVWWRGRSARRG